MSCYRLCHSFKEILSSKTWWLVPINFFNSPGIYSFSQSLCLFTTTSKRSAIFLLHNSLCSKDQRPLAKGPAGFSKDHKTFSQRTCFSAQQVLHDAIEYLLSKEVPFVKDYVSNTLSVCRIKSFVLSNRYDMVKGIEILDDCIFMSKGGWAGLLWHDASKRGRPPTTYMSKVETIRIVHSKRFSASSL